LRGESDSRGRYVASYSYALESPFRSKIYKSGQKSTKIAKNYSAVQVKQVGAKNFATS
jgi:hypothetical protein